MKWKVRKNWKYTNILLSIGDFVEEKIVLDGSGGKIKILNG